IFPAATVRRRMGCRCPDAPPAARGAGCAGPVHPRRAARPLSAPGTVRYGACRGAATAGGRRMESRYTPREEIANSVIHGLGIIASIVGLAILVGVAARDGDVRELVAGSVFGATLILAYTASTLYHGVPVPRARPVLRKLD